MDIVSLHKISKSYGRKDALLDVSEKVIEGETLGLLGPSGAGKSTLIKIILGACKPTSGEVKVFGKQPRSFKKNDLKNIGLMVENCELYERFSCFENLKIALMTVGLIDHDPIYRALDLVGLNKDAKTLVSDLSTGMKQRLQIARAFLNKPKLIILDEPTSGLDPGTTDSIHQVLRELKEKGTTILLATHNMKEATLLCDRVLLIDNGKKIECSTVEKLCDKYAPTKSITVRTKNQVVNFENTESGRKQLSKYVLENEISNIYTKNNTLEDVFLKLTGRGLSDECI